MIIGTQKPLEEIWAMAKDFKNILVFGCNTCVAVCHAGGEKEAETLASLLRMKAKANNAGMAVEHRAIMRHCEPEYLTPVIDEIRRYDLVLSTACGVGVNFLAERIGNVVVHPAVNTSFYGAVPEAGLFIEQCAGCGDCVLHLTGGICPIARCAKTLMNGPCGGTNKGKCEIGDDVDCAWYLIVERMKQLGTLDKLTVIQPPRNWATARDGGPRRLSVAHLRVHPPQEPPEQAGLPGGKS